MLTKNQQSEMCRHLTVKIRIFKHTKKDILRGKRLANLQTKLAELVCAMQNIGLFGRSDKPV